MWPSQRREQALEGDRQKVPPATQGRSTITCRKSPPPRGQGAPKGSGTVPVVRPMGGALASSPKPSLGGVSAWLLGPLTRAKGGGVTLAVRGTGTERTQAEPVVSLFFLAPRSRLLNSVC